MRQEIQCVNRRWRLLIFFIPNIYSADALMVVQALVVSVFPSLAQPEHQLLRALLRPLCASQALLD